MKTRICEICKTELTEELTEELQGRKVHKGYCAEVLVEILTREYKKENGLITEQQDSEISDYQLL